MKRNKSLTVITLAAAISVSTFNASAETEMTPMSGGGYGQPQMMGPNGQGPMANPMMMQRMMQMRQQRMAEMQAANTTPAQGGMPMMGNAGNEGRMPMMGGGKEGGMPMMQMMQAKQAMMKAHMAKMETHLANIEALLTQLVQAQAK